MHELAYASGLADSMWKTNNLCAQAAFKDRSHPGHLAQIRAACAHGVVIHHRSILVSRHPLMESMSRPMSMRPSYPDPLQAAQIPSLALTSSHSLPQRAHVFRSLARSASRTSLQLQSYSPRTRQSNSDNDFLWAADISFRTPMSTRPCITSFSM
jgi:hypothetical protein